MKRIILLLTSILLVMTSCGKTVEPTIPTETPITPMPPTTEEVVTPTPTPTPEPTPTPTPPVTEEVVTPTPEVTPEVPTGDINNTGEVNISEISSSFENISLVWKYVEGVEDFNVYYKKKVDTTYLKLDKMLIRQYPDYYRADILGISEGEYDIKVISVKDNIEVGSFSEASINVISHDRSGFSFLGESTGAYKLDGTLKENAQVIYVTKHNAKTVTANVNGEIQTGLQTILDAKQKRDTSNDVLCIRIIGTISLSDLDHISSSSEGLQVKGRSEYTNMNITIEGVGNDAYFNGFGMLIRNCSNVEVRNLGFINFMDDGISIDTDNSNLWIHNNDFYYGKPGGDSDQAKGDGSLDIKKSKYITVSYNHFWDSGKCCLIDASTGEGSNYITYHHNWFDHADSRMPRVRNASVHVYNNYFDGVSKYGIGAAGGGSSVFSEGNYFNNTKHPYLSSKQGTDALGDGTFSGEDGGIIKSYDDYIVGGKPVITFESNNKSFDVYVAKSLDEAIPNTVKSLSGGYTYSNFDTSDDMYQYDASSPLVAKENVILYSGRFNTDLTYVFKDSENTNYNVITELKSLITTYKSTLLKSLGEEIVEDINPDDTPTLPSNPGVNANIYHNFTVDGLNNEFITISGNTSTSKGTVTYNNLTLTTCLKMESETNISFTLNEQMTLILVFGGSTNPSGKKVKIDGTKYEVPADGIYKITLEAGIHTVTKGDSINLFYIALQ